MWLKIVKLPQWVNYWNFNVKLRFSTIRRFSPFLCYPDDQCFIYVRARIRVFLLWLSIFLFAYFIFKPIVLSRPLPYFLFFSSWRDFHRALPVWTWIKAHVTKSERTKEHWACRPSKNSQLLYFRFFRDRRLYAITPFSTRLQIISWLNYNDNINIIWQFHLI